MKFKKLLALVLLMSTLFISCKKDTGINNLDNEKKDNIESKEVEYELLDYPIRNITEDDYIKKVVIDENLSYRGKINESEIAVTRRDDRKNIYSYNLETKEAKKVCKVIDDKNYLYEVSNHGEWVVWIEDEDKAVGNENLSQGFNWFVAAKNIKDGRVIIIDKAKYTKDEFELKADEIYNPIRISIANDIVVYRSTDKREDGAVITKIMSYNLSENKLKEVEGSEEVENELLNHPKTDGDKIIWTKLRTFVDYGRNFYKYSDLYLYDIKTEEKRVVTKDMFVNSGAIKDNTIVISIQKPGEELEDDLLIYDLDVDKLSKLIYKDNEIYKGYGYFATGEVQITDKYIFISIGGHSSRYIFDRKNKVYIDMVDEELAAYGYEFNNSNSIVFNKIFREEDKDGNGIKVDTYYELK
ncbi:hypothetical protein LGK99_07730 [Clostridium algidicarnis]|uniref:hypothetical protein n=1 Tax=Clostridium algidicarnis TaxID=37659 RepID=UPI00162A5679|nr:hypothetical protein [Clostridium algidicarnis]MBB6631357.1 hypothetical protein [Clostridium algidicarnis]MBU3204436.1 hypothetical protein [Clostridium algidicarnis]MBU3206436.1 hypothetical protein [Clostridium algidicarnis]MBU3212481.1 hypothetical protein [Clostridium algidicarnis]MBU3222912.1 hypothetical protein [Clostridium algidicarnis]